MCVHMSTYLFGLNTWLYGHVRFLLWSHEWIRVQCSQKSPPSYLCSCWLECIEGKQLSVLTDASRASYFREGLREERCSVCAKKLIFSVDD